MDGVVPPRHVISPPCTGCTDAAEVLEDAVAMVYDAPESADAMIQQQDVMQHAAHMAHGVCMPSWRHMATGSPTLTATSTVRALQHAHTRFHAVFKIACAWHSTHMHACMHACMLTLQTSSEFLFLCSSL